MRYVIGFTLAMAFAAFWTAGSVQLIETNKAKQAAYLESIK